MCWEYHSSILINSKDRNFGNVENAYFARNLNLSGFDGFSVKAITFLNNIYPINSYNNSLQTVYGATPETLQNTITPGNYTASQLASALQTELNFQSNANGYTTTYTVVYNSTTGKITITATAGQNLESATGTLAPLLGFNATTTNLSNVYVGSDPVNITYSNAMSITSSELTKFNHPNIRTDGMVANFIYNVPIGTMIFGANVYWESKAQHINIIPWDKSQIINNFDINLYDDYGRLVPMNNSNYTMELNLYKKINK